MRNAFAAELVSLAAVDRDIVLLSGDIGNRLFNPFKERFPDRFFNCGVAEANMTGMAAGMALCGLRPVTYTITPFNTARCLEQIKVDICYQNLPVVLVGVGAGLAYAGLGATHHSLEDIAITRVLPNMTVLCPGDAVEVRLALKAALNHAGPVYLRLGKKNEPVVYRQEPAFAIGNGIVISHGRDVCLLSTGNMLPVALATAEILKAADIVAQVVSMPTVKPLDSALLETVFKGFEIVATLEEHYLAGGFGSSVAEWLADHQTPAGRLFRFGVDDTFLRGTGAQDEAREGVGLTPPNIASKIIDGLGRRQPVTSLAKPSNPAT